MASFPQDLPTGASLTPPSLALLEPGWFKKLFPDSKGGPTLPGFKVGPGETNRPCPCPPVLADQPWSTWKAEANL